MNRRGTPFLLLAAAAVIAAVFAGQGAAARSDNASIGELRHDGADTVFTPQPGVAQNLSIVDAPIDFGINKGWKIKTLTTGTTIANYGRSPDCDAPILLFNNLVEWVCKWSLRVELGDLDDRLVSTAVDTRPTQTSRRSAKSQAPSCRTSRS